MKPGRSRSSVHGASWLRSPHLIVPSGLARSWRGRQNQQPDAIRLRRLGHAEERQSALQNAMNSTLLLKMNAIRAALATMAFAVFGLATAPLATYAGESYARSQNGVVIDTRSPILLPIVANTSLGHIAVAGATEERKGGVADFANTSGQPFGAWPVTPITNGVARAGAGLLNAPKFRPPLLHCQSRSAAF